MRVVAKVMLRALGVALLLLPLLGLALQELPGGLEARLDTWCVYQVDRGWPRRAVANHLDLVARGAPAKVLVLGSSNAMAGFRVPELEAELPGFEVHNLGVLGVQLEELEVLSDLLVSFVPEQIRRASVAVVVLHYDQFQTSMQRFGTEESRLSMALRGSGFYRRDGPGYVSRFSPEERSRVRPLLHPLMLGPYVRRVAERSFLSANLRRLATGVVVPPRGRMPDLKLIAEIDRRLALAGPRLPEADFRRVVSVVRTLAEGGFQVAVVDSPLPDWLQGRSPYLADYQARIPAVLSEVAGISRVAVVDIHDVVEPGMFWDPVHPREELTHEWSAALASRWPFPRPPASGSGVGVER